MAFFFTRPALADDPGYHAGSNTMNFCVAWLAPARKFGVVVCINQGDVFPAADAAAGTLIKYRQR